MPPTEEYGFERNGVCGKGRLSCREPASEQSIMAPGMYVCEGCALDERQIIRDSNDYAERMALEEIADRFEFRVAEATALLRWGNA